MIFKERKMKGVFEIQLDSHKDERGFFMRVYDDKMFDEHGLHRRWVQESHSVSKEKGVIRGMHFQLPPYAEAKIIRVTRGKIFDVYLDLRKDSPSFGKWGSIELSTVNKRMIYIPRGFAHGFCTLADNCELFYKMDNYYAPDSAYTILWNDSDVGIEWPIENPILSEKDLNGNSYKDFVKAHGGLVIC